MQIASKLPPPRGMVPLGPQRTRNQQGSELSCLCRGQSTQLARNYDPRERELDPEQKRKVEELKKKDQAVREHEQAHLAAGGGLVRGGASYTYTRGPDGRMYAVAGEVQIDVSPEQTPEATIRKMEQVRRAALAPKDPSPTDRAVAARAAQIEARARMEKRQAESQGQEDRGGKIDIRA